MKLRTVVGRLALATALISYLLATWKGTDERHAGQAIGCRDPTLCCCVHIKHHSLSKYWSDAFDRESSQLKNFDYSFLLILGFSSLRNFASFLLTIHFFTLHSTLSLCCYTFLLLAGFVLTLVLHKPPTSHSSRSLSWIRFRVIQPLSFSFSFASLLIHLGQR